MLIRYADRGSAEMSASARLAGAAVPSCPADLPDLSATRAMIPSKSPAILTVALAQLPVHKAGTRCDHADGAHTSRVAMPVSYYRETPSEYTKSGCGMPSLFTF